LNDHEPPHVHVHKAGNECRVGLDPVVVLHNYGFNPRDLRRIVEITNDQRALLLKSWHEIYGDD
jgi:hypothetical protein